MTKKRSFAELEQFAEKDVIRRAMSILGSRTSPRKAAAVRENGKKGGNPAAFPGRKKKT